MQLILHTPYGARINRAWGLALRKRFCRSFNLELQAAATDNGFVLSLTDQHAFPLDAVFEFVKSASVEQVLTQALLPAPMFTARWRWNASRALAILRFSGGRKVPPQLLRMRADDLLAAVFPDQAACPENLSGPIRIPDHVLVRETIENCLHEAMDIHGLLDVLRDVEAGAHSNRGDRYARAFPVFARDSQRESVCVSRRRTARRTACPRGTVAQNVARRSSMEPAFSIPQRSRKLQPESWPVVRDPDELHDALASLVVLPPVASWNAWFEELVAENRATRLGGAYGLAPSAAPSRVRPTANHAKNAILLLLKSCAVGSNAAGR